MIMTAQLLATCLFLAAQTYSVPPDVLVSIMHTEGGRVGQQVKNTNGSYDLGPMQINTLWLPELAKHWGVSKRTAWQWVRDDGCINVGVGAWILRQKIDDAGSVKKGIAWYHSATPHLGSKYQKKVLGTLKKFKGINPPSARITQTAVGQVNTVTGKRAQTQVAASGGIPKNVLAGVRESSGAQRIHVKPVRKGGAMYPPEYLQKPVPKPVHEADNGRPVPKPIGDKDKTPG